MAVIICDLSARNESHVGLLQVDKMGDMQDTGKFFFFKLTLKPGIIISRPEMGSTPQSLIIRF